MASAALGLVKKASPNIIVASSNEGFCRRIVELLRSSHWSAAEAHGGAEALAKIEECECQLLLLDRWLPDLDVTELSGIVKARYPQIEVSVVDSDTGAPLDLGASGGASPFHEIFRLLQDSPESGRPSTQETVTSVRQDTRRVAQVEPLPGMIGTSGAMQDVYRMARLVAPRTTTTLVTGETGTGKELVARAVHLLGPRNRQPFITVNCAAIPEALLESELFGYVRGAFTGAFQSRLGRIHAAHNGTLFLDEVGELPLSMQAKLLRFLQEGEVQRLGGSDIVRVDVRVIAATNADLARRVTERQFREDLYYRISVFPIDILPLRKRLEDVLTLGMFFLDSLCQEAQCASKVISFEAEQLLEQHSWPGNVRELRHVMERAFILSEEGREILPDHVNLQMSWKRNERNLRPLSAGWH
jgi:transcriptional regulator with GAF, ATPase, and Fis domain/CheY-like chemotaxis protein